MLRNYALRRIVNFLHYNHLFFYIANIKIGLTALIGCITVNTFCRGQYKRFCVKIKAAGLFINSIFSCDESVHAHITYGQTVFLLRPQSIYFTPHSNCSTYSSRFLSSGQNYSGDSSLLKCFGCKNLMVPPGDKETNLSAPKNFSLIY